MLKVVTLKFVTREAKFLEVITETNNKTCIKIADIKRISLCENVTTGYGNVSCIEMIAGWGDVSDRVFTCIGPPYSPKENGPSGMSDSQRKLETEYSRLCEVLGVCRDFTNERVE